MLIVWFIPVQVGSNVCATL